MSFPVESVERALPIRKQTSIVAAGDRLPWQPGEAGYQWEFADQSAWRAGETHMPQSAWS